MTKNNPRSITFIALTITLTVMSESTALWPAFAKTKPIATEVRVSREDGLIAVMFHTPSGGKVSTFLPANAQPDEAQIGGTVERELPTADRNPDHDLAEISGVVTIEPKRKDKTPPVSCPGNASNFVCAPPGDGTYIVTYQPPDGPPCTEKVNCPPPAAPPATPSDTCGIPQLAANNGNLHVSMVAPPNVNPSENACTIGGIPTTCRAWSNEGCIFHVPPASKVAPGQSSLTVSRGNQTAKGQIYVAEVKMTCTPNHLKPGQPCTVTTTVFCPGMHSIEGGKVLINNYNPGVLEMPGKVIPIATFGP